LEIKIAGLKEEFPHESAGIEEFVRTVFKPSSVINGFGIFGKYIN
jgi:hypothetical protein